MSVLAVAPDDLGVRAHLHARLDLAHAGGLERARALDLDDAHAADADRLHARVVAEDGDGDPLLAGRVPDRVVLGHRDLAAVDLQRHRALGQAGGAGLGGLRDEGRVHAGASPWGTKEGVFEPQRRNAVRGHVTLVGPTACAVVT